MRLAIRNPLRKHPRTDLKMKSLNRRMREDWDERAKDDALYWVNTTHGRDFQDTHAYFKAGKDQAVALISPVLERLRFKPTGKRILDVGCAVGRMFPGFRELKFGEIWGIDISPEMIKLGRQICPVANAQFVLVDGPPLKGIDSKYFDFCFSRDVFQHFSDVRVLWSYLDEIHRALAPGAAFQLQFRGSHILKSRVLIWVPTGARRAAQVLFRIVTLRWLDGRSVLSPPQVAREETWGLGVAVSPKRVVDRLQRLGFEEVQILPDALYKDGTRYWAIGRKPLALF